MLTGCCATKNIENGAYRFSFNSCSLAPPASVISFGVEVRCERADWQEGVAGRMSLEREECSARLDWARLSSPARGEARAVAGRCGRRGGSGGGCSTKLQFSHKWRDRRSC